jgi:hypothetical protein
LIAVNVFLQPRLHDEMTTRTRFPHILNQKAPDWDSDGFLSLLYHDAEQPLSFTLSGGVCQLRASLSNNFPRTTPRFETVIPSGRTGWMKLWSEREAGLLGAMINFNASAGANSFNQGHNLHKLSLTNVASVIIPVFPPTR